MLKKLKQKFNGKKQTIPTQQVPRKLEEIMAAFKTLSTHAGELQYNVAVYEEELKRLNQQLANLNYEAAARQQLDKEAAAEAAKSATTDAPSQTVQ